MQPVADRPSCLELSTRSRCVTERSLFTTVKLDRSLEPAVDRRLRGRRGRGVGGGEGDTVRLANYLSCNDLERFEAVSERRFEIQSRRDEIRFRRGEVRFRRDEIQ